MTFIAGTPGQLTWINAAEARLVALEALTVDTGWTNLTLLNSWVAFGAPYGTPHYRRKNGIVYVQAAIKSGTTTSGTNIFTLPALFRPLADLVFTGPATPQTTVWGCTVHADGTVTGAGLNATISLANFSFPAEQ